MTQAIHFSVSSRDSETDARVGRLDTPHGSVNTPAYCPVGTQAAVRGLTPVQVSETGTQMILANTYHLHLRPGEDVVREAGGIGRFMGWDGPVLTDSGGFQVFSLGKWSKIDDEGVSFNSHIDGSTIRLTPERVVEIQNDLGSDIMMVLDHCPPLPASRHEVEEAVRRTERWALRSKRVHQREDQALFGIVQGGTYMDLREKSLAGLLEMDFPGYAIGGVAVGESKEEIHRVVAAVAPQLPGDRPRYLMGLGQPDDLLAGIAAGIDLFDCVIATREARNATLYTRDGLLRMRNATHERDFGPVDSACACYTCKHFSRAYLRHLHGRKESLSGTLGTIHNIQYFQDLMLAARAHIEAGDFAEFWRGFPESFRSQE